MLSRHARIRATLLVAKRSSSRVDFTYFFRPSLDGFIADANGGVAWLDSYRTPDTFARLNDFMRSIDGAVMGRNTYEKALAMVKDGPWPMPKFHASCYRKLAP